MDKPELRPEASLEEQQKHSQRDVDVIDLEHNSFRTVAFQDLVAQNLVSQLSLFATRDYEKQVSANMNGSGSKDYWYLDFNNLLKQTSFPEVMRRLLHTLQAAYGYPVDIEFTCNFRTPSNFAINLLQCRPFQVKCNQKRVSIPKKIPEERIIFATIGKTMGENMELRVRRIVYIVPEEYAVLTQSQKYEVARLIGKLNHLINSRDEFGAVLLGPGRWGSSTPSLGIPVSFAEINRFTVLGEIAFETNGFVPELSYGTHFFQNLIENQIFYLMVDEKASGACFRRQFFQEHPNQLTGLLPYSERWEQVVRVIDSDFPDEEIRFVSEITRQKAICRLRNLS